MTPNEILALLEQARYDLSVTQTRVVDAARAVKELIDAGELKAPPAYVCPECGASHRGPNTLAEHRYHVHAGPVPAHYLTAEAKAWVR